MDEPNRARKVVVLGASSKPERYSNKAIRLLLEHGHRVIPVHPAINMIEGLEVKKSLDEIKDQIDTLTVYLSPAISTPLADQMLRLNPKRIIFNPGTENPALRDRLAENSIEVEEACTLVLLQTGQF